MNLPSPHQSYCPWPLAVFLLIALKNGSRFTFIIILLPPASGCISTKYVRLEIPNLYSYPDTHNTMWLWYSHGLEFQTLYLYMHNSQPEHCRYSCTCVKP